MSASRWRSHLAAETQRGHDSKEARARPHACRVLAPGAAALGCAAQQRKGLVVDVIAQQMHA
eukprot:4321241-Prymnesium_polylepis.1